MKSCCRCVALLHVVNCGFFCGAANTSRTTHTPTSFCHLVESLRNDSVSVSDILAGTHLTVASGIWDSFFLRKEPEMSKLSGFERDLLDEFAERARLTYDLVLTELPNISDWHNTSEWDNFLFFLAGQFDMVAWGYWQMTPERLRKGLGSPFSFHDSSLVFASNHNTQKHAEDFWARFFHFAQPFTGNVWLVIVCSVVATGSLFWYIEGDGLRAISLVKLPEHICGAAYQLTAAGTAKPTSWAGRILHLSWSWCIILILAAYTANLASFLVVNNQFNIEFKSLSGAIGKQKVVCMFDTASVQWMEKTYPDYTKLRTFVDEHDFVHALSSQECDGVLVAKFYFYQLQRHSKLASRCKLQILGDIVLNPASGWSMVTMSNKCTRVLHEALSYHFRVMTDDGTYSKLLKRSLDRMAPPCQEQETESNVGNARLDLNAMSGILIIHAAGCAVSIILFLSSRYRPVQQQISKATKPTKSVRGGRWLQESSMSRGSAMELEDAEVSPSTAAVESRNIHGRVARPTFKTQNI